MEATEIVYKPVTFKKFVSEVRREYEGYKKATKRTESELAVCIGKSNITVRNCFNTEEQIVSDKILTSLIRCIEMIAKIEWIDGKKIYYIENK